MAAHTVEVVRNSICGSPSRAVRTAGMVGIAPRRATVGIAPRRATVGRVERPTTAADVPPAEAAGVPSAEAVVAVVVDTPVVAAAGGTLAEAIDKFETFERVEVSRKLR